MRVCGIVFILLVFVSLAAAPAGAAAVPDGVALVAKGTAAFVEGRLGEAEALLRRAIEEAPAAGVVDQGTYACALRRLGATLSLTARSVEAETMLRRALEAAPGESAEAAECLADLAALRLSRGDGREAQRLAARALEISERRLGKQSAETVPMLNILADTALMEGDLDEADRLLRQAERRLARSEASDVLKSAVAGRRGRLYLSLGQEAEAEPLLERSLALAEDAYGPDHAALAPTLVTLGDCYRRNRRVGDAGAAYERALALGESSLGLSDPALLPALAGLAEIEERTGDVLRAKALRARSSSIARTFLPPQSIERAEHVAALAALHARHGEHAAAAELYGEALAVLDAAARSGEDVRAAARRVAVAGELRRVRAAERRRSYRYSMD